MELASFPSFVLLAFALRLLFHSLCLLFVCCGVAGAGRGVREQWMPSCFSVFDGRWARSVVSVGSAKGGTDVEITGWSAGLASGTGTITWRANTRIGAYVDHTHRNSNADEAAVVSIEQELENFIDTYRRIGIEPYKKVVYANE